jgi:HK97 family phage prohead protease
MENEKLLKKLADGREYRSMQLSARSADNSGDAAMIVEGYAATFNQPYVLYEGKDYRILEQIDPVAFKECDMADVIFQYNHTGRVFARTKNHTLTCTADNTGLKITADLGGTEIGRQLYAEIKGGYTDKMSFGFVVAEDKRESTEDHETGFVTMTRTITKVKKLYDVSAVSFPANDATSISARNFSNGVIEEMAAERTHR